MHTKAALSPCFLRLLGSSRGDWIGRLTGSPKDSESGDEEPMFENVVESMGCNDFGNKEKETLRGYINIADRSSRGESIFRLSENLVTFWVLYLVLTLTANKW